jgi:Tol biopolymer transport system component
MYESPDRRWLATRTNVDPMTKAASLLLVPAAGGGAREVFQVTEPESFAGGRMVTWTPDNSSLLVAKRNPSGVEMWQVPVNGGSPRKLDIDVGSWLDGAAGGLDSGFSLSPDGRQIAFMKGKHAAEVWAIENFLPPNR